MRQSKIFVTVDILIFRKLSTTHEVLLIQRKNDPFKNAWAIPGGFVDEHEDLEDAAKRELLEETGLHIDTLKQVQGFGKPYRDPRSHTVSIAFYGWAADDAEATAADDAADARWFSIGDLPELAFDHSEIIQVTREKMGI